MKAYDFQFGERTLSSYGFIVCSFDSGGLDTIDGVEVTFNVVPSLNGQKHELASVVYEDCLEATIQICKHSCSKGVEEITASEYREITRWLSRKSFSKLKILDDDHIDLYYEAAVTSIGRIEIDGKLYGLELNIITNRPFALHEPKVINLKTKKRYTWEKFYTVNDVEKGETTGTFVSSYDINLYPNDGVKTYEIEECESEEYGNIKSDYYYKLEKEENVASFNDSSYEEGHIYPYTEIIVLEEGDLNIHSVLENRDTYIANCSSGEIITMDYPIIKTDNTSHNIQNDFNWNFFRVANTFENSRNDLITSIPCSIKIKYSPIVKVGL